MENNSGNVADMSAHAVIPQQAESTAPVAKLDPPAIPKKGIFRRVIDTAVNTPAGLGRFCRFLIFVDMLLRSPLAFRNALVARSFARGGSGSIYYCPKGSKVLHMLPALQALLYCWLAVHFGADPKVVGIIYVSYVFFLFLAVADVIEAQAWVWVAVVGVALAAVWWGLEAQGRDPSGKIAWIIEKAGPNFVAGLGDKLLASVYLAVVVALTLVRSFRQARLHLGQGQITNYRYGGQDNYETDSCLFQLLDGDLMENVSTYSSPLEVENATSSAVLFRVDDMPGASMVVHYAIARKEILAKREAERIAREADRI